jgi:hypothetical protein
MSLAGRKFQCARAPVIWLAALGLVPAAAIAAPVVPRIDTFVPDYGFAEPILDDGGWRLRSHSCCRGRSGGSDSGALGRVFKPRLGDRDHYYDRRTYGDRDDDVGASYDDYYDKAINDMRLDPPRVYQRDSFGGGYFGNPE